MLKGTLILVLAYVASVYCAALPEANIELAYDPCLVRGHLCA